MRMLPILCLAIAGCTPTAAEVASTADRAAKEQARLDRELAGYTADSPQNCLASSDRRLARSQNFGSTILYRVGSNRIVRNDMNGNCPLDRDRIVVTQTPTSQLCRGDIVQLLDRVSRFPMGNCAYGDFVTYRKVR